MTEQPKGTLAASILEVVYNYSDSLTMEQAYGALESVKMYLTFEHLGYGPSEDDMEDYDDMTPPSNNKLN